MMVESKLGMLMEVVEEADDVHDLDNEQPTASVASRRRSNLNNLISLRILSS